MPIRPLSLRNIQLSTGKLVSARATDVSFPISTTRAFQGQRFNSSIIQSSTTILIRTTNEMSMKRRADVPTSPPVKKKVASNTTKANVANFFKPASEKEAKEPAVESIWGQRAPDEKAKTSMLVAHYVPEGIKDDDKKTKIAAFDLDSTLIEPASNRRFAKGADDWRWWHPSVAGKLESLYKDGYQIAIFSNQGGLTLHPPAAGAKKGPKNLKTDRVADYQEKCAAVFRDLGVPVRLYAATAKDRFRKPRTGMWEELLQDCGLEAEEVDMEKSFFVGDAAGRPAVGKKGKDFSCSDRNLAWNVGVRFQTPEEFFLGERPGEFVREFDPENVGRVQIESDRAAGDRESGLLKWEKKAGGEIVLFCGRPGAGKSSLWWSVFEPLGFERINQDQLGSRDKCISAARHALSKNSSVVIDNTNRDKKTRAYWVAMAKEFKLPIRCVHLNTPKEICIHNDAHRSSNPHSPHNPENREVLPGIAFSSYEKAFEEPQKDEGFEDIVQVEFKFRGSDSDFKTWAKFYS